MKLGYIIIRPEYFSSNEEAIIFVKNYVLEKNVEYYLDELQRWEHRWEKCVDYVEKLKKILYLCWVGNFSDHLRMGTLSHFPLNEKTCGIPQQRLFSK